MKNYQKVILSAVIGASLVGCNDELTAKIDAVSATQTLTEKVLIAICPFGQRFSQKCKPM